MQLASQSGEPDQKMSPSIYAALIDSLFRNSRVRCSRALVFGAIAAGDDGAEDRRTVCIWPCVALLIVAGAVRAFDYAAVPVAQIDPDRR